MECAEEAQGWCLTMVPDVGLAGGGWGWVFDRLSCSPRAAGLTPVGVKLGEKPWLYLLCGVFGLLQFRRYSPRCVLHCSRVDDD